MTPHFLRIIALAVVVGIFASVVPATVAAQAEPSGPPPISELSQDQRQRLGQLYLGAKEAFEAGNFVEAIDRLQRAYALYPDPDIFYRIGQAYEGLDDHAAAIDAYRSFLEGSPDAADRPIVENRIRSLERLIAADRDTPGVLVVETDPPGAKIWLDSRTGFPVATSPARLELSAGEHFLYLSAEGHDEVTRKVVVTSGATSSVVVALNRIPTATPSETSIAPWFVVGAGGVLILAGATTTVLAVDAANTVSGIDAERRAAYANAEPVPERPADYDAALQRERDMWVATAILGSAGAVLIGSGLVWWWLDEPESGQPTSSIGIGPTGASWRVTF